MHVETKYGQGATVGNVVANNPVAAEAESLILSFFKYQQLLTFLRLFLPAAVCSYYMGHY